MPLLKQLRPALGLLLWSACVYAQNAATSPIRISTKPEGARFYVDGLPYVSAQVFQWPQGSKHIVQFPGDQDLNGAAVGCQLSHDQQYQYCFSSWTDSTGALSAGNSPIQTVTASPSVTWLEAQVQVSYKVRVRFLNAPAASSLACAGAPGNAPQDVVRSGLLYVGADCFASNGDIWATGGALSLNAFPYPGFVFTGWDVNGEHFDSYLKSYDFNGPATVSAEFLPAKRVQIVTNPPGLKLLIDGTPTPTASTDSRDALSPNYAPCKMTLNLPPMPPVSVPALCFGQFDFLPGSKHVLDAISPQLDGNGKYWVLDHFSNGAAPGSTYIPDQNTAVADQLTANFVPGIQVNISTNPAGLKLNVDGRDNWPNYNFIWAASSTHSVTAASTQVDGNGRRWNFQGWSNGGAPTQTLVVDGSNSNVRLVANYAGLGQLKVVTNPAGVKMQVDGADCVTPCSIDRPAGAQVTIAAPSSSSVDPSTRLDFLAWGDGAASTRSITITSDVQTVFANYAYSYKLQLTSDPAGGADFSLSPFSPDLYYADGTVVTLTAMARPGFHFRRWTGDTGGLNNVGQVTMSGGRSVTAMLERVPYIAPASIESAAGPTPDGTVAPGSLISIYGDNIAPRLEIGPRSPLAQSLADVVVTVNDRILPLLFVSPQQINAQLPSDLTAGDYTLTIHWTGHSDVPGQLTISRNAPALFSRMLPPDSQPLAMAVRQDGTPVNTASPAHAGDLISVYGTGFGPFDPKTIDGFAASDTQTIGLTDAVEVHLGDQTLQPDRSVAAPGLVAMTLTRFRIPDGLPAANVELTVKINGKSSNVVLLPVQ